MKVAAMVLVAVMAAVPGNAQTGTSLDCAKASNKVERTICGNVDLRDAERTVNAEFAALAGRLSGPAKEHTPPVGVPHDDQPARQTPRNQVPEQHWWCKSDFAVRRPAVDAIALAITYGQYRGQPHPVGGTTCHLVDLRTGRRASPGDVFVKGDGWRDVLVPLVRAELEKQFIKQGRTDFDQEIKPDKIATSLSEEFFCYRRDGLKLTFGPYVFGTYADGSHAVDVPYSVMKPILASDGPLGSLR